MILSGKRILLVIGGGIAAYKALDLIRRLRERGAAVRPVDLTGEPFVLFAQSVSPDYHDRILAICAEAGFRPDVRHEVRHWLAVVSLVAQGLGVSMVPAALQQAGLPGAAFVPLQGDTPPYETRCLWRSGAESAALAAFLDAVRGFALPTE